MYLVYVPVVVAQDEHPRIARWSKKRVSTVCDVIYH